nr:MAG TPA: hypothetical protein [Caudoviricetes sp.]
MNKIGSTAAEASKAAKEAKSLSEASAGWIQDIAEA